MLRVNSIINNQSYKSCLERLSEFEKDRIFCRHNMEHFLDTARIMYITVLENNLPIKKDVVYATALLHDIGRVLQYENGTPHHRASADFARDILPNCGFSKEETDEIVRAILSHRSDEDGSTLGSLLYLADKKSRLCFNCRAEKDCYWSSEKKNREIEV